MNRVLQMLAATAVIAAPAPLFAQAMPASTYIMKAGAGDLYEKQSSQIVMMSTTSADLKKFAQQMITDHTKSTEMVKAAAMKAHMKVMPPKLAPDQAKMIADLKAATGTDRDQLYIQQQKMAHQDALTLHQDYATNGTSAPLKMAAEKIVPVVQMHINMLGSM